MDTRNSRDIGSDKLDIGDVAAKEELRTITMQMKVAAKVEKS